MSLYVCIARVYSWPRFEALFSPAPFLGFINMARATYYHHIIHRVQMEAKHYFSAHFVRHFFNYIFTRPVFRLMRYCGSN